MKCLHLLVCFTRPSKLKDVGRKTNCEGQLVFWLPDAGKLLWNLPFDASPLDGASSRLSSADPASGSQILQWCLCALSLTSLSVHIKLSRRKLAILPKFLTWLLAFRLFCLYFLFFPAPPSTTWADGQNLPPNLTEDVAHLSVFG